MLYTDLILSTSTPMFIFFYKKKDNCPTISRLRIDGEILGLGYLGFFSKGMCNILCEMNKSIKLKK